MYVLYYKFKKIINLLIHCPISIFSQYKIQIDSYNCGPIAIHNALLANNKKSNFKHLIKECNTNSYRGTSIKNMDLVIRKKFKKVTFGAYNNTTGINIDAILEHLNNNGIIIVRYMFEFGLTGHYALLIDNKITIINPIDGKLFETWSVTRIIETMKFAPENKYPPCFWLIGDTND